MDDNVLFRMQLTRDGVLMISKMPSTRHEVTVEAAAAKVLRTIAESLESGATRLTQGDVS